MDKLDKMAMPKKKVMTALAAALAMALLLVAIPQAAADVEEPKWTYSTGGQVHSVSISSDGSYIAAGGGDCKVYLFSKDSGTPLWTYTTGDDVLTVSISSDGAYIVAGGGDYKVYLFSKDSGTPLWIHDMANWDVNSVSISSDGSYIAAGSEGDPPTTSGKIRLFSKDSGTPLWTYTPGYSVHSVSISSDGSYIAAGSYNWNVYLFSNVDNTPLWTYAAESQVHSVSISSDGSYIAAGGNNCKVYLFSKDSGTPLWSFSMEDPIWVGGGATTETSWTKLTEFKHVGDQTNFNIYYEYRNAGIQYTTTAWFRTFLNGADYGTAKTATIDTWLEWSEELSNIDLDDKVQLYGRASAGAIAEAKNFRIFGTEGLETSVSISSDGSYIAVGFTDYKVYLFSKANNTPLWFYTDVSQVHSVSISSDGSYIAAGPHDKKVHLFGKANNTPIRSGTTTEHIHSVSVSSDGAYIVAGGGDYKVYLFGNHAGAPPFHFDASLILLFLFIGILIDLAYLYYKVAKVRNLITGAEAIQGVFIFLLALVIMWGIAYGLIEA